MAMERKQISSEQASGSPLKNNSTLMACFQIVHCDPSFVVTQPSEGGMAVG